MYFESSLENDLNSSLLMVVLWQCREPLLRRLQHMGGMRLTVTQMTCTDGLVVHLTVGLVVVRMKWRRLIVLRCQWGRSGVRPGLIGLGRRYHHVRPLG